MCVANLPVWIIAAYFLSATIAEVSPVPTARYAIGGPVHHVIAGVRVVLLDQLVTGGTLLRPAGYLPGFKRVVVHIHGAPQSFVPGLLTTHTEELSAVGALHPGYAVHVQRKIDEITAEDTPHSIPIYCAI